jgi:uncharacterized RDD family membrane protein YckC
VANIIGAAIGLAYYAYLNGQGQTLGKKALGIKTVRMQDGGQPGLGKGVVRHIIQFFEFLPALGCLVLVFLLVDSLWPLWDGKKQALHDKLAGTGVIKVR